MEHKSHKAVCPILHLNKNVFLLTSAWAGRLCSVFLSLSYTLVGDCGIFWSFKYSKTCLKDRNSVPPGREIITCMRWSVGGVGRA